MFQRILKKFLSVVFSLSPEFIRRDISSLSINNLVIRINVQPASILVLFYTLLLCINLYNSAFLLNAENEFTRVFSGCPHSRKSCTFYNGIYTLFAGFCLGKLQTADRNYTNNVIKSGMCSINSRICAPGIEKNISIMNFFANYY